MAFTIKQKQSDKPGINECICRVFKEYSGTRVGDRIYSFLPRTDVEHRTGGIPSAVGKWYSWLFSRKYDGRGMPIHTIPRRHMGMATVEVEGLSGA